MFVEVSRRMRMHSGEKQMGMGTRRRRQRQEQFRMVPEQYDAFDRAARQWIRNGLNTSGCIESAVISGRQAARAIIKGTYRIIGETDFV